MTLQQLEKTLKEIRISTGKSYSELSTIGLQYQTIAKIEKGENYTLSSLYRYINGLEVSLIISTLLSPNIVAFGSILQKHRKEKFSLAEISLKTGLNATRILAIEKGRGCERKSLLKYLEIVPLDFNIKDYNHG